MRFLLVCEGASDIPIIQAVVEAHRHELEVLVPPPDVTRGSHQKFGWTSVVDWCRKNRSTEGQREIDSWLAFSGAALLLLHMDTDVAEQIDPGYAANGLSRRQCCEQRLNKALGTSQAPSWCHYVLPTMATETWLLALHDNQTHPKVFTTQLTNYEAYPDPESMLLAIGYAARDGSLDKSDQCYKEYARQLVQHIPQVQQRCAEFDALCSKLEGYAK